MFCSALELSRLEWLHFERISDKLKILIPSWNRAPVNMQVKLARARVFAKKKKNIEERQKHDGEEKNLHAN